MGRAISFSEFADYYQNVRALPDNVAGAIFDTNILISLTYEVKANHDEVFSFFERWLEPERDRGFRFFTTVNTRSEFLDFNRRLMMTENLRDLVSDHTSQLRLASASKTQIQYQSGQLKRREQQGSDPVFNDTQIKTIKSAFSAGKFSGNAGWLALCNYFLDQQLDLIENDLEKFGIEYISQHEPTQENLFSHKIEWADAKRISETSCLSLSDAMILNAFQCSRFPFMVSSDFDIGYAVLASRNLKDVVMPDSVAKKYRAFHFEG
jgi:hypothetical protein